MTVIKKFLVGLIVVLACNFFVVAHAAEVDPYFAWEIKNLDDYQPYDSLFKGVDNIAAVKMQHDEIYKRINEGQYFITTRLCENFNALQKILFGADYFDAGLTELTAKLYLQADDFDAAERKINFLSDNAPDNLTKIRALNLKSDLLNRRGQYAEALAVTKEVDELLRDTPDEKLSLINQSRAARAYCGLDEIDKSLELAKKISAPMQNAFGENALETFALISTGVELCRKTQNYATGEELLKIKSSRVLDRYEQTNTNLPAVAESETELADFYFEIGDAARGEEKLNQALYYTDKLNNPVAARKLYKEINRIAVKNLGENHPLTLNSEYDLFYINSTTFGDLPQAIEFYEKNLPKFKKIFGEDNVDTLDMMDLLATDYLLLGNYSGATKVTEERLRLCKKYFGEQNERTINGTVDLAKIYYRMGKYKTADNLLADIQAKNGNLFQEKSAQNFVYQSLFAKADGARLRGDIVKYSECLREIDRLLEENSSQYKINPFLDSHGFPLYLEIFKVLSMNGLAQNIADFENTILKAVGGTGVEYHPELLKMRNAVAESYVEYGDLREAERYTNQILRFSKTNFGEGNFYEWMALNTLSKIRRAEGNFSAALEIDNRALLIAETVCGKKSLERMQSLDAVASDHAAAGNFAEAIKIREQTLSDYEKILEEDDAATIQMMTNLAADYVATNRYADAVKLCDETLALQKVPVYTNNHLSNYPSVTELIRIKATAQKFLGDNKNAYVNYTNLIQVYEARRAAESNMITYLSNAENKSKQFAEIIPVYKDAASVAASNEIANTTFAFYCTEFCKGRNLIDRFDDILVAKDYLLTPAEKKSLVESQKLLEKARALSEYAVATNDNALFIGAEIIYDRVRAGIGGLRDDLREKYSDNMIPKDSQKRDGKKLMLNVWDFLKPNKWQQSNFWSWDEILKNFDVQKNRQAIPNDACFVEFMKVSDDSLVVTFLRNDSEVNAANIPVDKKFFDDCRLYHELNSYFNVKALNNDGKFLWQLGDKFTVTESRERPADNADVVKDNEKFNELRQKISAELSEKLLPTIEKFAGNSKHWIISPDAELNLVPFETLTYREKFLIESVDISYVPSLAVLNLMKNRERKNAYLGQSKEFFAMGDAVYNDADDTTSRGSQKDFFSELRRNPDEKVDITTLRWKNLPGTARELDKVSPLFTDKEILRREQVTEKNLRTLNAGGELSKYKYMLFAAHGLFVPERPEYSSIVLSQNFNDEDNDGYVTVGEWMSYDLRSNLIYLSACESGRGDYQAGEGIVGIPYALTVAGNKDTVMSLWKVNDAATAEFTSAVFEKLSRGQSEVAALNETKREFLRGKHPLFSSPYVWAAFVLYGI